MKFSIPLLELLHDILVIASQPCTFDCLLNIVAKSPFVLPGNEKKIRRLLQHSLPRLVTFGGARLIDGQFYAWNASKEK